MVLGFSWSTAMLEYCEPLNFLKPGPKAHKLEARSTTCRLRPGVVAHVTLILTLVGQRKKNETSSGYCL